MKYLLKKIDVAALLISIYTSIVWAIYMFLFIADKTGFIVLQAVFIAICSYLFFTFVLKNLRGIDDIEPGDPRVPGRKEKILVFTSFSIVSFALMMIWFGAYYPGSFSVDSMTQYSQAVTGEYDDWHPVWHTVLFFTLPLKLFGRPSAIILFQMIYFALVMGYLALTLCEILNLRAAIISLAYILLNPYTGNIMLYPWKDVAFALGGLLCTIFSIRLIFYEEKSTKGWKLVLFGIVLASTTIFRHNAILFTAPLVIALFFYVKRKTWIKVLLCTFVAFFIIEVPVYHLLNVQKPDQRVIESMGLPMTVIANVAKETPDLMDEELAEFVYSIATGEQWTNHYYCGSFNSIKWSGIDTTIVEEKGHLGTLKLMAKCFKLSPKESFKAMLALTDMVYGFENGLEGNVTAEIVENSFGIQYREPVNETLRYLVSAYSDFINNSVFRYLRTYGVVLLVLLVVFLSRMDFCIWDSWKKVFMMLPIFAYDFGTMLLLTGPDSRFFFITYLVTPILIIFAFYGGKKNDV